MPPSVYDLLQSFDSQNKFDGTNYQAWAREFNMTFLADPDILGHVKGTSQVPSDPLDPGVTAWESVDASARMALYKTISSNAVCDVHFKETTPAQTANQVWESLKSEYQKDSRASRFLLKKRLYNPVHDINQPISVYIQDIIAAADALTSLGHPPSSLDVVDSIIMNLNSSFGIVRTILTIQSNEPSLGAIKKMLIDQEDTRAALGSWELGEITTAVSSRSKAAKAAKKGLWASVDLEDDERVERVPYDRPVSTEPIQHQPNIRDKMIKGAGQKPPFM